MNPSHSDHDVLSDVEPGDRNLEAADDSLSTSSGCVGRPFEEPDGIPQEGLPNLVEVNTHVFVAVELPRHAFGERTFGARGPCQATSRARITLSIAPRR